MSDGQQQDPNTGDPGAQEPHVDWHDKFLGQKKVNSDLEAKLIDQTDPTSGITLVWVADGPCPLVGIDADHVSN